VLASNALKPRAVLSFPVVFACKDCDPEATLNVPVVFDVKDK